MKQYNVEEISHEFTNLDYARQFFPKCSIDESDRYIIGVDGFEIEWLGEGETFLVNRTYMDYDVGWVTDDELFVGNFGECVEYVKKQTTYNEVEDEKI